MKIVLIIVVFAGGLTWLVGPRRMGRLLGVPAAWMDHRGPWVAGAIAGAALLLLAVLAYGH